MSLSAVSFGLLWLATYFTHSVITLSDHFRAWSERMRKSKIEALRSDMRHATEVLREQGYAFDQVSDYQLKIKDLSFYPRTGTIYRDGDKKAFRDKGLEAFTNFLEANPGFRPFRPAPKVKLEL